MHYTGSHNVDGNRVSVSANAAYDTAAVYEAAGCGGRGAPGEEGERVTRRPTIGRSVDAGGLANGGGGGSRTRSP